MNGLLLCTPECNLRCKYCFEETLHCQKMLPIDDIREAFAVFLDRHFRKFLEELIAINESLGRKETDITFHGGEPLLIGHDLLRKGCEIIKSYPNTTIGMQTNSSLVDDTFIELFLKYNIQIGTSIDGPQYMHDAYRINAAGAGSFDRVFRNIIKMKDAGVAVGALATVTDATVQSPEDFYNFFKDISLDFSFNPCFTDPNLPKSYTPLDEKAYIRFARKMFDLWINDKESNVSITCFERIISAMCVKSEIYMEVCSFIKDCSRTTVAITPDGDFFRCLHYCMDHKNRIGNIQTDNLNIALGNEAFGDRCNRLFQTECKDCDIQSYCNGGCPYVAEAINHTIFSRPNTCACQKDIVHYIFDYYKSFYKEN